LIVDAYGGVGLFSATVIPPERDAVLIEVIESSCGDAVFNLANRPVRIVQTPLESWTAEPAAIVIADPPRDGLRASAVEVLAATGAAIVVLVSCDPASLGRDARLLQAAGYRFSNALVTEAFPHTHHVETVSRFNKITDVEI
jgi:23S rRNA (uracil1939-C5)-methyltransferase